MKNQDLTGMRFGRLTVVKAASSLGGKWESLCDCGKTVITVRNKLTSGHTRSCGCLLRDTNAEILRKKRRYFPRDRSMIGTVACMTLERAFKNMHHRVRGEGSESVRTHYRDRGVTVCPEWSDDTEEGFANFFEWAMSDGGWEPGYQLDKEAVDQDNTVYSPATCKFVPRVTNATRRRKVDGKEFLGVFPDKQKFYFWIIQDKKTIARVHGFTAAIDAAKARDHFIIENRLPHRLNFPELRNEHPAIS